MKKRSSVFKISGAVLSLSVFSLVAIGCATSPTGRKQLIMMPDGQVNEMGVAAFEEMKKQVPVNKDAAINTYVKCIANEITSVLPEKQNWEVVVFQNDEPNAFALPGGKIGVHTGMLKVATDASQLAAVIGHEVGHVLARHSNERVSEASLAQTGTALTSAVFKNKESKTYQLAMAAIGAGAQYGILLPHSRAQESEADVLGLDYMSKAGFDPRQSVALWQNMAKAGGGQPPEFMSTHPSHGTRISELQANMAAPLAAYEQSGKRSSCKR